MGKKVLLEKLAEELLRDHPSEEFVRSAMVQLGLPTESDPIIRLEMVLKALRGSKKIKPRDAVAES